MGDFGESTWRKILAKEGKTLEGELEREVAESSAVRRAVSEGLRHLLPYLSSSELEIRESVATALGNYPEHADGVLPASAAALATETDEEIRESLFKSKTALGKG